MGGGGGGGGGGLDNSTTSCRSMQCPVVACCQCTSPTADCLHLLYLLHSVQPPLSPLAKQTQSYMTAVTAVFVWCSSMHIMLTTLHLHQLYLLPPVGSSLRGAWTQQRALLWVDADSCSAFICVPGHCTEVPAYLLFLTWSLDPMSVSSRSNAAFAKSSFHFSGMGRGPAQWQPFLNVSGTHSICDIDIFVK